MNITRRDFTALTLAGTALGALRGAPALAQDAAGRRTHGSSLTGALKYPADFAHYDYVNPDAPKGGLAVTRELVSGFDSFNPFVTRGQAPWRLAGHCVETLMSPANDQGSTQYGLLAEWLEEPDDYSWVRYKLRDGATWSDGAPVTVADVIFSLDTLKDQGRIFYGQYYKNVVESVDLGDGVVEFRFDITGNRELPQILGQLAILPKHYWETREFGPSLERPMVSGPYEIGDFQAGRFVEFVRRPEYWGADLPVNIGLHNFDRVRYQVYGDTDAALQAFQAGDLYFRAENSSRNWATRYEFPAVEDGRVKKMEPRFEGPKFLQGFAFNLRRSKFQNRLTRRALAAAFDFQWANDRLFYSQYAQPYSYFQGTESLMATGAPEGRELEILEAYRDQLPPELFIEPFTLTETDGSGRDRRVLRKCLGWLREAGWTRGDDGILANAAGEKLTIDFPVRGGGGQERILNPYRDTLQLLGVRLELRVLDSSNYAERIKSYDFDMMIDAVANSESPGNEQREYWGTEAADVDGGRNAVGLKNPVIDALIEDLIVAHDRADLEAYSKALDRVLLWEFLHVMELYTPFNRLAFWVGKVTPPTPLPPRSDLFPAAWWAADSAEG